MENAICPQCLPSLDFYAARENGSTAERLEALLILNAYETLHNGMHLKNLATHCPTKYIKTHFPQVHTELF